VSRSARTLYVFALYLGVVSLTLLFAPNVLLSTMGMATTTEVWIRVVGMLTAFLALYYYVAARVEAPPAMMWATVLARLTVPVFFLAFILEGWVEWPLILFGVVDAIAAMWTWSALAAVGGE